MAKLYYQGHGSYRIIGDGDKVIYIDPYAGDGYDKVADIILVTHQHFDHNATDKVGQKPGCVVITEKEALEGGKHNSFKIGDISIEAVTAANQNHNPSECVGYIITVDGVKVYAAGDTSKTDDMSTFAAKKLDYAILPCDGQYNMDLDEAAECAKIIGAKRNIPIHLTPGTLFDRERAEKFNGPNRLIVAAGEEITL